MKKLIFNILIMLLPLGLTAQVQLYKTSLAPDGGSATQGTQEIVYTTGEVFVAEQSNGTQHLSEGFVGPDMEFFMELEGFEPLDGVIIYPNPVKNFLNIRIEINGKYNVRLYDLTGKLLYENTFEGNTFRLDMKNYRNGYYLVSITDQENKRYSGFKIRKQ